MLSLHRSLGLLTVAYVVSACSGGGGGGGGGSQAPARNPSNLTAQLQGTTLVLDWNEVQAAVDYIVFAGDQPGFALDQNSALGAVAAPPVQIDVSGASGRLFFRVVARFADDSLSEPTNELAVDLGGGGGGGGVDPLLAEQWHLVNTGQEGGTPGEDAKITPVWNAGTTGQGIRIAIVDDGLEIAHEDLAGNVIAGASFNYVNGSSDPTGGAHGTSCAGVAAAVGLNAFGVRGAAFDADLLGFNLLQDITDANQGDAMVRRADIVDVSSNSWGAPDGTGVVALPPNEWFLGVLQGTDQGRQGKGIIYMWAAGNGATPIAQAPDLPVDDSNHDGQANFPFVIAVGAIGDDGKKAVYSENGANLLVVAHSEGRGGHAITTVDRTGGIGFNNGQTPGDFADANYTNTFNGTSSATPLAAGVVALMLDANPNLTWRDVRIVLARSARKNDPTDAGWDLNGAGLHFNHKYGFGAVDAQAAVDMARTFPSVGTSAQMISIATNPLTVNLPILDNNQNGVTQSFAVAGSGISALEGVQVLFDTDHTFPGDLFVILTSPSGTVSVLHEPHSMTANGNLQNWVFSTTFCMDEPADGTWTIRVIDVFAQDTGTFRTWQLGFLGR